MSNLDNRTTIPLTSFFNKDAQKSYTAFKDFFAGWSMQQFGDEIRASQRLGTQLITFSLNPVRYRLELTWLTVKFIIKPHGTESRPLYLGIAPHGSDDIQFLSDLEDKKAYREMVISYIESEVLHSNIEKSPKDIIAVCRIIEGFILDVVSNRIIK